MKPQKRFTIGGFHVPYSLAEIQDTPDVIAAIDRLAIGESWDDGNGSETVTRIADAVEVHTIALTAAELIAVRMAIKIAVGVVSKSTVSASTFLKMDAEPDTFSGTEKAFLELDRKFSNYGNA